ncbi:MAG TPA: hypothetical protein VLA79_15410 [Polyangia bacterium]|nr:hypothetical protein [Polyangia bacterium]
MTRSVAGGSEKLTLSLSIGGIVGCLSIEGAQPVFLEQVRARYGAFILPSGSRGASDFSLQLALDPIAAPGSSASKRLAETEAHPLKVTTKGRTILAERWDFRARLQGRSTPRATPGRGVSYRRISYRGEARCEASPFALDCLLRVVYATLLPRVGGMLIHGCGLRHAAIGVIFPGVSGAGKSTLARKAPDADDVLSDELVVVRRLDDGWRVFGTPFWGDFARGGISMRSWPLRTVAFLHQAREVAMAPITSSDATLRLLGCFLAFTTDRASVERSLAVAVQLCAEVRSVEASLTRTAPTATVFRKLAPHLGPEVTRPVPPANARELISEFRALLRKQRSYAFKPKGAAGAWLKSGESLAVQSPGLGAPLAPGDVVLAWVPGPTPDEDALACRRLSAADARDAARGGELLGRVTLVSRDGKSLPLPGRVGDLARSFGPLVAIPMLKMAGR